MTATKLYLIMPGARPDSKACKRRRLFPNGSKHLAVKRVVVLPCDVLTAFRVFEVLHFSYVHRCQIPIRSNY